MSNINRIVVSYPKDNTNVPYIISMIDIRSSSLFLLLLLLLLFKRSITLKLYQRYRETEKIWIVI